MMFEYQLLWALVGLFFGLLLVLPHQFIPTRTATTKFIFLLIVFSSLAGMLGFFEAAWFLVACAIVTKLQNLISRAMAAINKQKQINEQASSKHDEHKWWERN